MNTTTNNEASKEKLKDDIRKLYGIKKSHCINFEPRLDQLMQLVTAWKDQEVAKARKEARLDELDYWFARYNDPNARWFNTLPVSLQRVAKRRLEIQAGQLTAPQSNKPFAETFIASDIPSVLDTLDNEGVE